MTSLGSEEIRIEDVFCILENMIGRSDEWNIPLWMISLDLRKAFDRIQHGPLFAALLEQGVPNPYIQLLAALYENQQGCVNGSRMFLIQRGVKQGDGYCPRRDVSLRLGANLEKSSTFLYQF